MGTKAFFIAVRRAAGAHADDALGAVRSIVDALDSDVTTEWTAAARALRGLTVPEQEYALATAYTIIIEAARRAELAAFFTPPHLVEAALGRAAEAGIDLDAATCLDPACGGAAFLVPLTRRAMRSAVATGAEPEAAARTVLGRIAGIEIDHGLAELSRLLVRRMLRREFGVAEPPDPPIRRADTLRSPPDQTYDLVIGNPPYGRIGRGEDNDLRTAFADVGAESYANRYALFTRRALDWTRPGGAVVFIVPTSFVGGPYYERFRARVLELAEPLRFDLVERRTGVFLDVTQDTALIVLRRRHAERAGAPPCRLGLVRSGGELVEQGKAIIPAAGGAPWVLGAAPADRRATLAEWGWSAHVGRVVWNREGERLAATGDATTIPLVWAKDIRPDGSFRFDPEEDHGRPAFVRLPSGARGVVRDGEAVVVQRTSNRKQSRRLIAAHVPAAFAAEHGGWTAENHVLVLLPIRRDHVPGDVLVRVLNSKAVDNVFAARSGTVSVSARLLNSLPLPPLAEPDERAVGAAALGQPEAV